MKWIFFSKIEELKNKNMTLCVVDEKKRQMDDLMDLMTKQAKFYNDILKEAVPVPLRLLYLTQIEYLNSRQFIIDVLRGGYDVKNYKK